MKKKLMVQHVANAGLLLTDGINAILVDPFTDDPEGIYEETTPAVREELLEDIGKGWIDMLVVTHEHADHFNARDAETAMKLNGKIKLVTTVAAAEKLADRELLLTQNRLIILRQEEADHAPLQVGDFRIDCCHVKHEGEQYARIDNLALMIEWQNDRHILITGDAEPGLSLSEAVNKHWKEIDWVFAPFPYIGTMRGRRWMKHTGKIRNVFALHFPKEEKDEQGWRENTLQFCRGNKDPLTNLVIPGAPGKWYTL